MSDAAAHALEPSPPPIVNRITTADVAAALRKGLADFKAAPSFGLVFAAFYVVAGIVIYLQLSVLSQSWFILPLAVGFPLIGPFAAVGLYEVSRRLETGEPLDWAAVVGVVFRQKDRQLPSIAVVVILVFLFWIYAAHLIFALFFGLKAMTNVMSSAAFLWSADGVLMLAIGSVVGGALAFFLFSITVVGLPLVLEREIDFVSAMIASVQSVLANMKPMLLFGAIAGGSMIVGIGLAFVGLFVTLPVLGHATWRLYRKAIRFED